METFQCSMTSRRFQRKPWLLLIKKKKRKKKSWNYRVDVNIWNVEDAGAPLRVDLLRIGSRRAHQPARQRRPLPPRRRTLRSLAWVFCFWFFCFCFVFFGLPSFFLFAPPLWTLFCCPAKLGTKYGLPSFTEFFFHRLLMRCFPCLFVSWVSSSIFQKIPFTALFSKLGNTQ